MKLFKKIVAMMLVVALVLSYQPMNAKAASKGKVKSISVTNVASSTLVLKKNSRFQLKYKVNKTGAVSKKVKFTTSNKKVVKVSSKGKLTAVKKGAARITIKSVANKKVKKTIKVIVGTRVRKITLSKKSVTLDEGKSYTIRKTIAPSKASYKKVKYSTSDKKVATVNKNGKITAVKAGVATITVYAMDGSKKKATMKVTVKKAQANDPSNPDKPGTDDPTNPDKPGTDEIPQYEGYTLKWNDEFDGDALDTANWNYELHEPGWVNQELQAYVKSDDNIYVKDGKLVIKAIKEEKDGVVSYTSGRVNTQNKQDFKYGRFEVSAKVPAGQGFLPAFWMMPTNENLYGQWPLCGEIDAMEVMGQDTSKLYGTIHYGKPHKQSQGTKVLTTGDFASEFHKFSVEWEPDHITWYVDDVPYHTESYWYSRVEGKGEVAYPAPFDQPFYMILNLAVGGSWVGNPDDTTSFDDATFEIEYVRAYQKDSYNEDVTRPELEVVEKQPDSTGNYLDGPSGWILNIQDKGDATYTVEDENIVVNTVANGTQEHSVQLKQTGLPIKKGLKYRMSFDAYADEARTMKVAVEGGDDDNWTRYLKDTTVELTTEKQHYSYEFTMERNDNFKSVAEFNLGKQASTAKVYISNVRLEVIGGDHIVDDGSKVVLADGNLVYNGEFQEGAGRLGYWDIVNNSDAQYVVTNENNIRRFKATVPAGTTIDSLRLEQTGLAFTADNKYAFSVDVETDAEKTIRVTVCGEAHDITVSPDKTSYGFSFVTPAELSDRDLVIELGNEGVTYIDNVRIEEDKLIKNGSFDAGTAGFEVFADGAADVNGYVVDSINNPNSLAITINDTGDPGELKDNDWYIQLKQNNINLVNGQWYKLSLKAKATVDRRIKFAIQRDGTADNVWTPYFASTEDVVPGEFKEYSWNFMMAEESDAHSIFSITMGSVDGIRVNEKHDIIFDDIILEKIDEPEVEAATGNLITGEYTDPSIAKAAEAQITVDAGNITADITSVGENDYDIQIKELHIPLKKDTSYILSYKAKSTKARKISVNVMSESFAWYGGGEADLPENEEVVIVREFKMTAANPDASLFISLGQMGDTPASTVTISDISLKENLIKESAWTDATITEGGAADVSYADGAYTVDITDVGTKDYSIQLKNTGITLEEGKTYVLKYKVNSTAARTINASLMSDDGKYSWYGGGKVTLAADEDKWVEQEITMKVTDNGAAWYISLGQMYDGETKVDTPASTITISNFSLTVK